MRFKYPKPDPEQPPLYTIEAELLRVRDLPEPARWAEEHFLLSSAYARPGKFRAYPWQREPINAVRDHETVILCGPTQTGKSLIAEIALAYCIDNLPTNALLIYSKKEVVEDVFVDRIIPMIRDIPVVRRYWDGKEKSLTRQKTRLTHMYMRVASSLVQSEVATWSSGLIYLSEVSKYRKRRGWDPVEAAKRRQEPYRVLGRHRAIYESSPLFSGDCLDQEMRAPGVTIRRPHVPCPHCEKYQRWSHRQVRELPGPDGVADHDPNRIREKLAAVYLCVFCKRRIEEKHRIFMAERIIWASDNEKIDRKGKIRGRKPTKAVAYQWNRFVDFSFTFTECLARYFSARRKGIEAVQLFMNEDMAEFWSTVPIQVAEDYLLTKKAGYRQFQAGDLPDSVLVVLGGVDTQDDGFYFVVNGYGRGMNKYLLRCGFVRVPKGETEESKDPRQLAYERLRAAIYAEPFRRRDGRQLDMRMGFIDRGGHRADDVDYICEHMPEFEPYIGLARPDPKKPLVDVSADGRHYNGQTQSLSVEMGRLLASNRFHLPDDIQPDYLEQVRNEYMEPKIDAYGNKRLVWVRIEPNHYRSCENYCHAAARYLDLESLLFDESTVAQLEAEPTGAGPPPERDDRRGGSDYFSRRAQKWW
jgi:phage terminase large subunit GpA-like protein